MMNSFGAVLLLAAPATAQPANLDEVRELTVTVEISRTAAGPSCRVLVSSGLAEQDRIACDAVDRVAGPTPRREVVRLWYIPERTGTFVRATPAGRLGAMLTTDDAINWTRTPLVVNTRYVVNERGRVERCTSVMPSDNAVAVGRACAIMTKRFRFRPATLDGTPVKDTVTQSFIAPPTRSR